MRKGNRVRPAWALLLAAVLALTGPSQSAGSVQAAEAEEKQSTVPDDTAVEIQEESVYIAEEHFVLSKICSIQGGVFSAVCFVCAARSGFLVVFFL